MKKIFITLLGTVFAFCMYSCSKDQGAGNTNTNPNPDGGNDNSPQEIFVSKTPSKRTILLEEFTGMKCGYCPIGHKTCDQLAAKYPGKCYHINIHAGSFATGIPNYKTTDGNTLLSAFFDGDGYPSGMVNRRKGLRSTRNFHPEYFPSHVVNLLKEDSYVNIAAKAIIDTETKKLTCTVQAYFTSTPPSGTVNLIHLALTQDKIKGDQTGGQQYYPAMYDVISKKYTHNAMLRDMITDVKGEAITENTEGTLYEKVFIYDIPEKLGLGSLNVVLSDLNVLAFITEQESAAKAAPVVMVTKAEITLK